MSEDNIRSKAFEWACEDKPWDENLEYSKHAEEGYVQGYIQAKKDIERQLAEAREVINKEKEFNQIIVDANEQYIEKYKQKDKEILKLKILVQQERYENQENKLNSIRLSSSHERVMEEEDKLKHIAKVINKLVEQLKEKGE